MNNITDELKTTENDSPTSIPSIKRTCTSCNCVCWMDGVKNFCIPYNACLKCYKECVRVTDDHNNECNLMKNKYSC